MKKIIIIGGGFAGIKVARDLQNVPDISVTLISDEPDFRYTPALWRTATGKRRRESFIPIDSLVENTLVLRAKAVKIDRAKQQVQIADGQVIDYDYCVIALGMVTNYFGIPGLDVFSYSIKSSHEIERFKRHLHEQMIHDDATDKNYIMVGAGPTGTELASALGQYIRRISKSHNIASNKVTIELIEAADRVLPAMSLRASRIATKQLQNLGVKVMTGCTVKAETKNSLKVDDRSIPSHTVVWTAGVANNPFFAANVDQFTLDKRGRVIVDEYLSVDNNLFVIGDNAANKYGGLALTAIHQANYVSRGIKHLLNEQSFAPDQQLAPIYAIPIGSKRAIVQWRDMAFGGVIAGMIRSFADIIGYSDIMGYRRAIGIWLRREEFEETCPICRAPQVTQ
jgi:NADH dehydrogenase